MLETYDEVMKHMRYEGMTHLVTHPDGSLTAYRPSEVFRNHWGMLQIAFINGSYHAGDSWILSETIHPDAKKVENEHSKV
jgi:hypothetical protein